MEIQQIELDVNGMSLPTLLCGPKDGPVVLMLHGFPDHPGSFIPLLKALGDAGFRAVAPTGRGYTPSALAPDGDYRLEALASDAVGCLDALGAERAHLFGHDWGAVVAHTAGALYAERFASITTVAVPHLARLHRAVLRLPGVFLSTWYQVFFQIPGLSDWAVQRRDWALVRWLCGRWSPPLDPGGWAFTDAEWAERVRRFNEPGVRTGMLAYYRQNLSLRRIWKVFRGKLNHLRAIPVRTLAITGVRDGCMDTRLYDYGLDPEDFPKGLQVERIEDAGHFVHLEQPDAVKALLLPWLARVPVTVSEEAS